MAKQKRDKGNIFNFSNIIIKLLDESSYFFNFISGTFPLLSMLNECSRTAGAASLTLHGSAAGSARTPVGAGWDAGCAAAAGIGALGCWQRSPDEPAAVQ